MASRPQHLRSSASALQIRDLHVYYGQSHALQGVSLDLVDGVLAVVGRNGMGKTTLCNTVMGLLKPRRGTIKCFGQDIAGLAPHKVSAQGVGYTPQGRRLWPSLNVDEHLRLSASTGNWTRERVYDTFPRLYERRATGAGQLSGGEQQMLAISRALMQDPQLLVLDEPTEGLAPVIVTQLETLLQRLSVDDNVAILLIEQNIGVATALAENVAVMVNGRIQHTISSSELSGDRTLQEQLLGVGRHAHDDEVAVPGAVATATSGPVEKIPTQRPTSLEDDEQAPQVDSDEHSTPQRDVAKYPYAAPTRWTRGARNADLNARAAIAPKEEAAPETAERLRPFDAVPKPLYQEPAPVRATTTACILVVGTFDTKGAELRYIREQLQGITLPVRTVDLGTSGKPSSADVPAHVVAAYHPRGAGAVFSNVRGSAIEAMALAFERWVQREPHIAGMISAAGSGGTALVTPAMRMLPIGTPKVMISTVASGDVGQYVGSSDIMMMYSVTDVQGLNSISKRVLKNGASALAGMVTARTHAAPTDGTDKPSIALSMFGVTTPAVQQITARLEDRFDCLVFHATGTGGRSMEKLVDGRMLLAALDITTTEICDMMMGGVFAATEDRLGAFVRTGLPYIGSVGALDMVNFGARDTVPDHYNHRVFVEHNPQVTLMRTTATENVQMGEWIAGRLNQMPGPVRFILPEGGVSSLDAPGQPFHDPAADKALFDAIEERFVTTRDHKLVRAPYHINDAGFTSAVLLAFSEITPSTRILDYATL